MLVPWIRFRGLEHSVLLVNYEILMFNDGATNVQVFRGVVHYNDGTTTLFSASGGTDTTSDADLTITGQLANAADTVKLLISLGEYIGRN